MSEQTSGAVWLTQAKFDELKAELEELRGPTRSDIVKRVSDARDEGDLKENGGYHAAKDEQGKQEARIRQLEEILSKAEVGETPPDDGIVEQGMKVTVRFVEFDEEETFLFGAREMEREGLTVYSPQSALGAAIDGRTKGETVSYSAPTGKEVHVEIIDAVPFSG